MSAHLHLWNHQCFPRTSLRLGKGVDGTGFGTCCHNAPVHWRWFGTSYCHELPRKILTASQCGMMVESRATWALSSRQASEDSLALNEKQILIPGYSTNPVPALIIFLLGTILGGHHQGNVESTMMHKWVISSYACASCSHGD